MLTTTTAARVHFDAPDSPEPSSPSPWSSRHATLKKLLPILSSFYNSLPSPSIHQQRPPYTHLQPSSHSLLLDHNLGYIIEHAQYLLSQTNLALSETQIKLLQRVTFANFLLTKDFVLVRKIADSDSGSVHLVKSKLSSSDKTNQSNLYILKTIPKPSATRLHQHLSPEAELSILLLSRTGSFAPIPCLHASFQSAEDLYFLTRFIPGGTLSDYILARPSPPETLVRHWAAELVLALDWLHQAGWTHRDVKPSNLLLDSAGHVLLTDFGTAAPLVTSRPPQIDHYLSRTREKLVSYSFPRKLVPKKHRRALVGTCDYIAPEVLDAHLHAVLADMDDQASSSSSDDDEKEDQQDGWYGNEVDYWSLGITLYELVYGQPAFFCQSIPDTYEKIVAHQEHLVVSSTSEWIAGQSNHVRLSSLVQSFLKSLIECRDVRIGCGEDGIGEVKRHGWFLDLNWDTLRTTRAPDFGQTIVDVSQLGTSVEPQSPDADRFHFSAFFGSSPGLSALHSSARSSGPTECGMRFWGFTYVPPADEFEGAQEELLRGRLKSSFKPPVSGPTDDRFVTPVRPRMGGSVAPVTGTVGRMARLEDGVERVMSGSEELKALVDHVSLTAKKSDQLWRVNLGKVEVRLKKVMGDVMGGLDRCEGLVEKALRGF